MCCVWEKQVPEALAKTTYAAGRGRAKKTGRAVKNEWRGFFALWNILDLELNLIVQKSLVSNQSILLQSILHSELNSL